MSTNIFCHSFCANSTLALCCVGNVPDEGGQNITFSFLQPIMYCKSFSVSFTYIFWVRQLGTVQTEIFHSHSQGHFVYFLQLQIVLLRAKRGHSFIASSHHHIKLKIWEKSEKKLRNEFSPRDMKCSSSDEGRAELYWWNCETGCCILMKSDTFKALCFFFFFLQISLPLFIKWVPAWRILCGHQMIRIRLPNNE